MADVSNFLAGICMAHLLRELVQLEQRLQPLAVAVVYIKQGFSPATGSIKCGTHVDNLPQPCRMHIDRRHGGMTGHFSQTESISEKGIF